MLVQSTRSAALLRCPPRARAAAPVHARSSYHRQQHRSMLAVTAALSPMQAVPLVGAGIAAAAAVLDARLKSRKPDLVYQPTDFNTAVLAKCPTVTTEYTCTPFLTNGHVETIAIAKLRRAPGVTYKREVLLMEDGGAVALDWEHHDLQEHDLPPDAPVLILFPGLTGGSGDTYVQHAVQAARGRGIRAVVFNSRGTADSPVTTPQFYSASFTADAKAVVAHVAGRYPKCTLFAAGWSLGANILVNYLAEVGAATPLEAAVSMCNPFELTISNAALKKGFNRIYDWNLAGALRRIYGRHELLWRGVGPPFNPSAVGSCNSIDEFDEAITIHSFGWKSVADYYAGSSSAKRIPSITIPLLCIQAADDPIAPQAAIPYQALAANPNCVLVVTPCGGHLGWASGPGAPWGAPWTDAAVMEWLDAVHQQLQHKAGRTRTQQQQQRVPSKQQQQEDGSGRGPGSGAGGSGQQQEAEVLAVGVHSSPHSTSSSSSSSYSSSWSSMAAAEEPPAAAANQQQQQQQQAGVPPVVLPIDSSLEQQLTAAVQAAVQDAVQAVLAARAATAAAVTAAAAPSLESPGRPSVGFQTPAAGAAAVQQEEQQQQQGGADAVAAAVLANQLRWAM